MWLLIAIGVLFAAENLLELSFDSASVVLAGALVYVTTVYARTTDRMAKSSADQVRELRKQTELSQRLAERQMVATAWSDVWAAHEDIADAQLALKGLGELNGIDKPTARKRAVSQLGAAADSLKARHSVLASVAAGLPPDLESPVIKLARDLLLLRTACALALGTVLATIGKDEVDGVCDLDEVSARWMTSERDKLSGSPAWDKLVSGEYADTADKAHDIAWEALFDWLHPDDEESHTS
ncbi:hypothetical protein [Demequina aestuarii]|uniref:hypothetical protein n=1 Tax=Demequina aestuarii TaxID=327095 RepID=UPI000A4DB35D|nr:hypothetical protein [Demequina aestuarii]